MKFYKTKNKCLAFLCVLCVFLSIFSMPVVAETGKTVTATTNETVKQGSTGYCYVYIDSLESLAALDVMVHFDSTKVKVTNMYNSVSCTLYENNKSDTSVQFSYIFDGNGSATSTSLFYFTYQVLESAEVGDAYFDITIGEAYDNSLESVVVSGSRCKFSITETVTTKSCSVFSSSAVSTMVEQEFSLSYRFSTYQLASGSMVIQYDRDLFEVVEVTEGSFLSNKVSDVNTDLPGAIYISFVGTAYDYNYDVVTIKFKTIKNVSETSSISCKVTELFDIELNPVSCQTYTTNATIVHDAAYVGDAPKMQVSASYDDQMKNVTAHILLDAQSNLGAGDFTLSFDTGVLSLSSYEKGFSPDFFGVNETEVEDGKLKFSIISMEDIVSEETVLIIVFDVKSACVEQVTELGLEGSVLTDSLTNAIILNLIGGQVTIPEEHTFSGDCDTICNQCDFARDTSASHSFTDAGDTICDICGYTRTINRNYTFSQNVQIGLIEPWFLRANAKVYISGDTSKTPIDYAELDDYGFYFVRESKLGIEGATADNVTAEQIIACESSVRYSKTNGKSHIKDGYAYADFDEGLYTYELSDSVFTVFFIEYEGKIVYAKVRERNLKDLVDTYKVPGVGNFSDEERAVFAAMSQMESDITAYRAGFDSIPPLALQTAPTLAENPLGAVTADTPYKFSRNYQVVLIEPWGLAINGKVKLDGNVIDYSTMQDYGVVVFYDVNGVYSSMDTETLLACEEAYVFSKQNGDAELNGEYIHAVYNKGIYSYQMTSKAYVMFYVQDADGNYHYSAVKEKTIQSAIQGVLGVSTSQTEINVLNDMLVLYQAVVDYRATLDE